MGFTLALGSAGVARLVGVLAEIPPPIPEGSALARWVLEQPLPLSILLAVAGVVAWYVLKGQGKESQGKKAAGVLVLLGVVVFALGTLIETEREKLRARTRELVGAVATVDSSRVSQLLADDAVVQPFGFSRSVILAKMDHYLRGEFRIKEHRVLTVRATLDGSATARTQVHLRVTLQGGMYAAPAGSWWLLHWRKDSATGQWAVTQIQIQQLDGAGDVSSLHP